MDQFFTSNPGMRSRIAHHLDFADYDLGELLSIGQVMLDQSSYYLSAEAEAALSDYLKRRMHEPRFANARSVRNELDRARLRHAHRLAADPHRNWGRDDLMRIEPEDILGAEVPGDDGRVEPHQLQGSDGHAALSARPRYGSARRGRGVRPGADQLLRAAQQDREACAVEVMSLVNNGPAKLPVHGAAAGRPGGEVPRWRPGPTTTSARPRSTG